MLKGKIGSDDFDSILGEEDSAAVIFAKEQSGFQSRNPICDQTKEWGIHQNLEGNSILYYQKS